MFGCADSRRSGFLKLALVLFLRTSLQEVRLYVALCLCHILRLSAPDTPFSDEQLQVCSFVANPRWETLTALLEKPAGPPIAIYVCAAAFCLNKCEPVHARLRIKRAGL